MSLAERYATLLQLSKQMLELAQRQEWEALAQMEAQRAATIAEMPDQPPALPQTERAAITQAIQEIQACDREILEYVTPWREQAATLLSHLAPSR